MEKNPQRSFILGLFALGIVLFVAWFVLRSTAALPIALSAAAVVWILALYTLVALVSGILFFRSYKRDPKAAIRQVLASTTFKFLIYLIVLVAVVLSIEALKKEFVVTYLGFYFIYTIFEKSFLYKSLRNSDSSNENSAS